MASRTGDQRLIARRLLQTPSARLCLALGLGLFLLAGCGGGGGDGSSTETSGDLSSTASQGTAQTKSPEAQGEAKEDPQGQGSSGAPNQANTNGGGGKQGPHIAPPKGPRETAPTEAQKADATVADMALESPAIKAASGSIGLLPAAYTCDGKDSWPTLRWQGVPAGTAELALFAMSLQPVEEKLFVDWAVAGLDPSLSEIEEGHLPKGAIVGRNGFGKTDYEICPAPPGETYMFAIYALPRALSPGKGFDARELRKEVLDVSGNVGLLPVAYAR